ncbi:PAQR family membrane homeostasis protein TrhA [Algoriphagus persicinus]|uniref:PAQR family membrane homeostasis protein TrhA n=1 Tax=Algoriphagus persicinus TaxID=3108754 RepID=UPI002B3F8D4C|nr:hemolysin III family protein [Algoriphagus sp. E1-3-M2]MEB2787226.1 hemolysin III family protein [Algoriphagus sp. E1-3-M2]
MNTHPILGFDDPIDSWTHLIGVLGVIILLFFLFKKGGLGRKHPLPILIYGFASIFLLSMSGTYHLLERDTTARYVLRILDHAGIFLLISGTLIAIHVTLFSGFMKWGITIITSVIAIVGITFGSIYFNELPDYMTHTVFLAFGWLGMVSVIGIWKLKKDISFKYLLYGGLAYTIGAILDWMNYPVLIPGILGPHELFHVAVLIGVGFHWVFILQSLRTVYSDNQKEVKA